MSASTPFPIGTPGLPWGSAEKQQWFEAQSVKRSYADDVLARIDALGTRFDVARYGVLSLDADRYPLMMLRSRRWDDARRTALITGGVHGYETSGVLGALRVADEVAEEASTDINVLIAPCVSPWGYETINRWNPLALDPNRSFRANSPSEEAAALMGLLRSMSPDVLLHIDLHETTDTDNTEFRPALSARDGKEQDRWHIPDGFYTVGDLPRPTPEFQAAIIQAVEQVTHIAPPDESGRIIGERMEQPGVIHYDAGPLGLCMRVTNAPYVTTTEVYPDSPRVDAENCIAAQVAAVKGALGYVLSHAPG